MQAVTERDRISEQNLELVHLFLNTCLASILYTRRLIRWGSPSFLSRNVSQLTTEVLESSDRIHEYFCSPAFTGRPSETRAQEFKMIGKGNHRCADQLYDPLSGGIMGSLRQTHLETLKVCESGDAGTNDAATETYTFVFTTHANQRGLAVAVKETDQVFPTSRLQASFKKGITALLISIRDLPPLSRHRRRMSFSLRYHDTCPRLYQPAGFIEVPDGSHERWVGEQGSLRAAKFETDDLKVQVNIQTRKAPSEADHHVLRYVKALQQPSSSRRASLSPTMAGPAVRGSYSSVTPELVDDDEEARRASAPVDGQPRREETPTLNRLKGSTSEALVAFSSELSGTRSSQQPYGMDFRGSSQNTLRESNLGQVDNNDWAVNTVLIGCMYFPSMPR